MDCVDHGRTRSLAPMGYALVTKPGARSRCVGLHRLVYANKMGTDLDGIAGVVVRHTCDNPRCINPDHLIGGTKADNNRDRVVRGRSAKVVPSRQALSPDQVAAIRARYVPGHPGRRNPDGVNALSRDFNVDTNVIYKVIRGTYVCTRSS